MPHKGKLLAGTAVFGSSFLATLRWLFGVWLPSAHQARAHGAPAPAPRSPASSTAPAWGPASSQTATHWWCSPAKCLLSAPPPHALPRETAPCHAHLQRSSSLPPPPATSQVLRHPATLSYLALSGLAGLGLTYYYNAEGNRKVNTMLRVALQLVGLASLFLRWAQAAALPPPLAEAQRPVACGSLPVAVALGARRRRRP